MDDDLNWAENIKKTTAYIACEAFATVFALVGNEIALLALEPSSDAALGWLTFGVFIFFVVDQLLQVMAACCIASLGCARSCSSRHAPNRP
eukprot:7381466-Prymnesium_polylepis.2